MDHKEVYPVEKIIKKRYRNNKLEYLVKWQNYGDSHNSWEPAKNFLKSSALKAFNDSLDDEKTSENLESPNSRCSSKPRISDTKKVGQQPSPKRHAAASEIQQKKKKRSHRLSSSTESSDSLNDHLKNGGLAKCSPVQSPTFSTQRKRPVVRGSFRTVSRSSDNSLPFVKSPVDETNCLNADENGTDDKEEYSHVNGRLIEPKGDSDITNGAEYLVSEKVNGLEKQHDVLEANSQCTDSKPFSVDTLTELEPPTLQVMVSDSELWLINERNISKQKFVDTSNHGNNNGNTAVNGEEKVDNTVITDADEKLECKEERTVCCESVVKENVASSNDDNDKKFSSLDLDVVLTDIEAHDYSVVIKECYASSNYFGVS